MGKWFPPSSSTHIALSEAIFDHLCFSPELKRNHLSFMSLFQKWTEETTKLLRQLRKENLLHCLNQWKTRMQRCVVGTSVVGTSPSLGTINLCCFLCLFVWTLIKQLLHINNYVCITFTVHNSALHQIKIPTVWLSRYLPAGFLDSLMLKADPHPKSVLLSAPGNDSMQSNQV